MRAAALLKTLRGEGQSPCLTLFCLCKSVVLADTGNAGIDDDVASFLAGELAECWERRFGPPRWRTLSAWADGLDVGGFMAAQERRTGLEELLEITQPSLN